MHGIFKELDKLYLVSKQNLEITFLRVATKSQILRGLSQKKLTPVQLVLFRSGSIAAHNFVSIIL